MGGRLLEKIFICELLGCEILGIEVFLSGNNIQQRYDHFGSLSPPNNSSAIFRVHWRWDGLLSPGGFYTVLAQTEFALFLTLVDGAGSSSHHFCSASLVPYSVISHFCSKFFPASSRLLVCLFLAFSSSSHVCAILSYPICWPEFIKILVWYNSISVNSILHNVNFAIHRNTWYTWKIQENCTSLIPISTDHNRLFVS